MSIESLDHKRWEQNHLKKCEPEIMEYAKKLDEDIFNLVETANKEIKRKMLRLTKDSWNDTAEIVISNVLMRNTVHFLNRFSSIVQQAYDIKDEELDDVVIELIVQYLRHDRETNREWIKGCAEKFIKEMKEASLTKRIEKKNREFRKECQRMNEEMEKGNE